MAQDRYNTGSDRSAGNTRELDVFFDQGYHQDSEARRSAAHHDSANNAYQSTYYNPYGYQRESSQGTESQAGQNDQKSFHSETYNNHYDRGEINPHDAYSFYTRKVSYSPERPEHSDFDYHYHQWRTEQIGHLDRDYHDWRQERYKKFSEDFEAWRKNKTSKS